MSEFKIISLILLGIVLIDATGDGFRTRRWQILHHILEVLGIAMWISLLLVNIEFQPIHVIMYITGRIALFDPVYNLSSGNSLSYIGKSSLYDRLLRKFAAWVSEPGMLIWVLRGWALIWWVAWFITNGGK